MKHVINWNKSSDAREELALGSINANLRYVNQMDLLAKHLENALSEHDLTHLCFYLTDIIEKKELKKKWNKLIKGVDKGKQSYYISSIKRNKKH